MSVEKYIDKVDEIQKVSSGSDLSTTEVSSETTRVAPNKDHFEALMMQGRDRQALVAQHDAVDPIKKNSLMDEVRNLNARVDHFSRSSPQDLVAQSQEVIAQIQEIKDKLASPHLELKDSVQHLLRNKLSHIDESLKIALTKAGVEYKIPEPTTHSNNPIERFLGFLTDGQNQLVHLSDELKTMHLRNGEISPASMLAVQIKVGYVQQELEFFTGMLNKALESTKTIMNVQV